MSSSSGTILLTGSWGKTASRTALLLLESGHSVLVASRRGADSLPSDVKAKYGDLVKGVKLDFTDFSTHSAPFDQDKGIKAIYLVTPVHPNCIEVMKPFIDTALERGVKRFVLLSAAQMQKGGWGYGKVHEYLVDGLAGRGIEYAIVRPPWFYRNFFGTKSINEEDTIVSAAGDGKFTTCGEEDIAEVAADALTNPKSYNRDVIVLGPELLSFDQIAELFTKVLGRKITHTKVSESEFTELLKKQGIPAQWAPILASVDSSKVDSASEEEALFALKNKVTGKAKFEDFIRGNRKEFEVDEEARERLRKEGTGLLGTRFAGLVFP